MENKSKSELQFELELINHLTTIGGVRQWHYLKDIRSTNQLWDNFKTILERNNQGVQ